MSYVPEGGVWRIIHLTVTFVVLVLWWVTR